MRWAATVEDYQQTNEREVSGGDPPLWVDGLTKRYDTTTALEGLGFQVERGEILGLVGPNGAGKTTALRSIVGVLPIQEGDVRVCGFDIRTDEVEAKRRLAWVPDDPEPFDTLTVDEHLEFTAALYRVKEWRERADQLLQRFELTAKRDALGGELSRGMRQKLAFSCAWLPWPRIVLLDEPLSGLDPRGIRSAKDAIRELAASGTAVILSSHLLALIEELADRLLVLDQGKRVFLGTLGEARAASSRSNLEEVFFAITGGDDDELAGESNGGEAAGEPSEAGRQEPGVASDDAPDSTNVVP